MVLVIDDEEFVRHFTSDTLKRYGFEPILAPDGDQGIRLTYQPKIGIPEKQDTEDTCPANRQQNAAQVSSLKILQTQQYRHDQIITNHCR